ncbi:GNAT family N-acetyltransferase [Facklamia sp. DSM 111018]|uniref:GNAT family N-acetyltransferase n=1 Tax=Facklamia lactis TaxID=2749967 RepID=A0ABS0LS87_9LACT|nr:GNAT family N-acetyltransferase [Facklamia lactis]MBG9986119.1 GNAT family N-acetyltransferase [Facklamia lactis]
MYQIRRATIDDLQEISRIEMDNFGEGVATSQDVFSQKLIQQKGHIFVADKEGKVIGFIEGLSSYEAHLKDEMFLGTNLHKEGGPWEILLSLVVDQNYQSQGIGRGLLNYQLAICKERGQEGVLLTCRDYLIDYYEHFGFENQGLSDSRLGGLDWYKMLLKLSQ